MLYSIIKFLGSINKLPDGLDVLEILDTLDPAAVAQEHFELYKKEFLKQRDAAVSEQLAIFKNEIERRASRAKNSTSTPDQLKRLLPPGLKSDCRICLDSKGGKSK